MRYCSDCKFLSGSRDLCYFHKKYIEKTPLRRGYYLDVSSDAYSERRSSGKCGPEGKNWSPTFIGFFRHLFSRGY